MTRAQTHLSGRRLWPLLVGLLWLAFCRVWSAETNQVPVPVIFRVGMAKVCFRNVNINDATAAYKVFLENQGRRIGITYQADPKVYDDSRDFEAAIRQQPMHMAVMEAWQFLALDIHRQMKPYFVMMENGKVGRKYLVLTRRDSGFNSLSSLQGKSLLRLEVANANTGRAWLDTQLLSEKLGPAETFFDSVEVVNKPTAAVLPVFFGKKAACVVDAPSFEMMKELNPQVGEMLQAVAVSDTFADVVICLSEDGWASPKVKADAVRSMGELDKDPAGRQICTLFKIDRMIPFEDSQLDTTRKLQAAYEALRKQSTPGPAPEK
jgi:phosphonate transport system substrate-binding protein